MHWSWQVNLGIRGLFGPLDTKKHWSLNRFKTRIRVFIHLLYHNWYFPLPRFKHSFIITNAVKLLFLVAA